MIAVVSLGGTIASSGSAGTAAPAISAGELVSSVPQLEGLADITVHQFRQVSSIDLTLDDPLELANLTAELAPKVAGIVIAQGTDTIEEASFFLDLLGTVEVPVVVTGAMRLPGLPGADGPADQLDSVVVASAAEARGRGVLVVMNGEIHEARHVRKVNTSSPGAFASPATGPVGWVTEGSVSLLHPAPATSWPRRLGVAQNPLRFHSRPTARSMSA